MRDKRPVDELSLEELERILAIRRREERMSRVRRYQDSGRTVDVPAALGNALVPAQPNQLQPQQHENAGAVTALVEPTSYDLTEDVPRFDDDVVEQTPVHVSKKPTFIEDNPPPPKQVTHKKPTAEAELTWQKRALNWGLLALEVAFVGALAIVLYNAFTGLESIQNATNQTQQELESAIQRNRVTPSPTAIFSAGNYLLPGGHTPPDENGIAQFNVGEVESLVPVSLRPAVMQELYAPVSLVQQDLPNNPIAVDIPAIGLSNATIISGDHWEALKAGIGHRVDSGRPGSNQNVVLTGHNDIYGEIFRDLPDLQVGDEIYVRDASGRVHTYRVREAFDVAPTDVWVLDPNLGPQLTLITCYPYKVNTRRWIVMADLVQ